MGGNKRVVQHLFSRWADKGKEKVTEEVKDMVVLGTPTAATASVALSLPPELWAMILGWIPTRELYPSCFLINKALLGAVLNEHVWSLRFRNDFNLAPDFTPKLRLKLSYPWRAAYKARLRLRWDEGSTTLAKSKRGELKKLIKKQAEEGLGSKEDTRESRWNTVSTFHSENRSGHSIVGIQRNVIQYYGREWMSVKASRGYSTGKHSFDFKIRKSSDTLACVGVVDQEWDSLMFKYPKLKKDAKAEDQKQNARPSCYWREGAFWDVSGDGTSRFGRKKAWKAGDTISVTLDFDKKEIHYFLNSEWIVTQPIPEHVTTLWPAASFYSKTQVIALKLRLHHLPLENNHINKKKEKIYYP